MNKKEVLIGFFVGVIANTFGTLLYIVTFSDLSIEESIKIAREHDHLGSLLALGALLNLVVFFGFIKLNRDLRAKGVLIATFLTAIIILILKLL